MTAPIQPPRSLIRVLLLVEDEPSLAEGLAHSLGGSCSVTVAHSSEEARSALSRETFDAVIADLNLRRETAEGLLSEITERHPAVRRILFSGGITASVRPGLVHAIVPKPASVEQLLAALRDNDGGDR